MTDAYRGVDAILEDRLARFRERRALEGAAGEVAARVLAVREGRIAGGAVGAAIAVAMFLTSVVGVTHDRNAEIATFLLPAGWMGAAGAMAVVRARALARATRALGSEPLLTGDAPADLALIGATDPLGELRARAVARETRSVAYPLAALSLLAPLTIHGAISLVAFIATGADQWARGFGVWIASSAVLVGLAHAALALQVVLWARSLRRRDTAMLRDKLHKAWSMAPAHHERRRARAGHLHRGGVGIGAARHDPPDDRLSHGRVVSPVRLSLHRAPPRAGTRRARRHPPGVTIGPPKTRVLERERSLTG